MSRPIRCKQLALLGSLVCMGLLFAHSALAAPFEVTYTFDGGFRIYSGRPPGGGFEGLDYYFTPLALDSSVIGHDVTIDSIEVSTSGSSQGDLTYWDWEVHLGPSPFGLPEGQFTEAFVDPVTDFARTAPTQFRFVLLGPADADSFSGYYDFVTSTVEVDPDLADLKAAITAPMDLTAGLYAQLFFWTAAGSNVDIEFDEVTLTVRGHVPGCLTDADCDDRNECTRDQCVSQACQHTCQPAGTTTCGEGICQRNTRCSPGPTCRPIGCTPGAPGTEGPPGSQTCSDAKDNDCDAHTDSLDSECTTCGLKLIDPLPSLVNAYGTLTTNLVYLNNVGRLPRDGLAADGVTRLLLRYAAPGPGSLTISIPNAAGSPALDGTLLDRFGTDSASSVTVHTSTVSSGEVAFAQYRAPSAFTTKPGDAARTSRLVTLTSTFTPDSPAGVSLGPCATDIVIVRPPVLLVHGFAGTPTQTWSTFLSNYVHYTEPGAKIAARPVFDISPTRHRFICVADYTANHANTSTFAVGAPTVATDIVGCLRAFRAYTSWGEPSGRPLSIAGAQVDVVAHSMGALLTRTIPLCQPVPNLFPNCATGVSIALGGPYRNAANYGAGYVRRLITLDTPHFGSPLAPYGLQLLTALCGGLSGPNFSPVAVLAALPSQYREFFVGVADGEGLRALSLGSDELNILNNTPGVIPTHFIVGAAAPDDQLRYDSILTTVNQYLAGAGCYQPPNPFSPITVPSSQALFGGPSDFVVAGASQRAHLQPSPLVSELPSTTHVDFEGTLGVANFESLPVTGAPATLNAVEQLLDGPSTAFAPVP